MNRFRRLFFCVVMIGVPSSALAQPTITNFTPRIGPPGTAVVFDGTNFSRTLTQNFVYFGAVRATVTNVTGNQRRLTAIVPEGATYDPVTITVGSRTATTWLPFRPTSTVSPNFFFAPKKAVGPGRNVIAADLNLDGKIDLFAAVVDSNRQDYLGSYRNIRTTNDTISFASAVRSQLGVARGPLGLAHGDFDGDGLRDVAVTSQDAGFLYVSIFRNTSTGSSVQFTRVVEIPTGGVASDVAIADLNNDGRPDLLVAVSDSNQILLFQNLSATSITFGPPIRLAAEGGISGVAVGDLNANGFGDIVVTERTQNRIAVFRNLGSGSISFAAKVVFGMSSLPDKIQLADFDNDGKIDIGVSNAGTERKITVRLNTTTSASTIALASPVSFPAGSASLSSICIGDINGDGKPDVAVPNQPADSVSLLINTSPSTGTVSFAPAASLATGRGPLRVAIADYDGDGRPDLAVAGNDTDYRFSETVILRRIHGTPAFILDKSSLALTAPLGGSNTDSLIVTNTGSDTLRIASVLLSNTKFEVSPSSATIPPGVSRRFYVTFRPQQDTTLQSDTVRFVHNATGSPGYVFVTGKGIPPLFALFSLSADSLSLNTPVGTSRTDSAVVANAGTDTLRILTVGGANNRFQVAPSSATIAQGLSRVFRITFNPQQDTTLHRDTLRFVHNAGGSPHFLKVKGRGLAPQLVVNRNALSFAIPVNNSRTDSILITNTGTDTLRITSVLHANPRFECTPATAQVSPGASKVLSITFRPQADTTLQRDTVRLYHNAVPSPTFVFLSGRGLAPFFVTNTGSLLLYAALDSSRAGSVLVSNTGRDTLRIFSVVGNNQRFSTLPHSATIVPGGAEFFRVTFTPQQDTTLQRDTLHFAHNAVGSPGVLPVAGKGIPAQRPLFQTDSGNVRFGRVVISSYQENVVRVFNAGTGILRVDSIRSSDPAFLPSSPDTATIEPLEGRNVTIRFVPTSIGVSAGVIRFYHNALERRDSILVSGSGRFPRPDSLRVSDSTSGVGSVLIRWNSIAIRQGFSHYALYAGTTSGFLLIADSTEGGSVDSTSKVVSDLAVGTRYFFAVTAVDTTGVESEASEEVSAIVPVQAPVVVALGASIVPHSQKAILRGSVNPMKANTTAWFEYDSIPGGSTERTSSRQAGNGILPVAFEDSTIALSAGSRYYFRLVARNSFDSVAFSAIDSFSLPSGGTPPAVPELRVPPENVVVSTTHVRFTWSLIPGVENYHLQIALDSLFLPDSSFFVLNDSTLTDSVGFVQIVAAATKYYWRVGARNAAMHATPFSSARAFTTESARIVQSPVISFPLEPASERDYRLVSIPGTGATVRDLIAGAGPTEGIDWRVFRDNGAPDTTGRRYLLPLAPSAPLTAGVGYWLIRKRPLSISRTVEMPALSPDGTVGVPLQEGHNIISNPFEVPVAWDGVRAMNHFASNARISAFTSQGYAAADALEPFRAYYFFKRASDPPVLKIPYPFVRPSAAMPAPSFLWRVQMEYKAGNAVDDQNFVGIAPGASETLDSLENHEPPAVFADGNLFFHRPGWNALYPAFSDDYRPLLGEGQVWDFEITNPKRGDGSILFHGIELVPRELSVQLVNPDNSLPFDLRKNNEYSVTGTKERMRFSFVVGTQEFVEGILSGMTPQRFSLDQNYPNPFNPSTSISYTLARAANVRLEVISVIGQHVKTLVQAGQLPARYTIRWNGDNDAGKNVASGVYFYRLLVDEKVLATKKMMLLQ